MTTPVEKPDPTMDQEQVEDIELKPTSDNPRVHLVPRPSEDEADPLNWPMKLKILILVQVCWLAFLGTWNTSVINPAYSLLAEDLGVSEVRASYQTTIAIALNGVGPFIWIPLANVYGRRFVYLVTTTIGFATALGSGFAQTFGALVGVRAINGLFPVSMALGPATVTDLFFYHQRGRALGLFTVMLTSGAHFASLFGGPVAKFVGWRWAFWITSAMNFLTLALICVALPETMYYKARIYSDASTEAPRLTMAKYRQLLRPWTTFPGVHLRLKHFVLPAFRMAFYPSVLFPGLYYSTQYCFAAIFPAVTYSIIFKERFGWNAFQCGLAYGGTMTIGSIAGEFFAGRIIDNIIRSESKRQGVDSPPPEARLKGLWSGAILVPAGLLIFGFTMEYKSHWVGPLSGMFIGIFGVQVVATVCYTYSIDSYRVEGSEVSQLINLFRQGFSCTIAFYAVKLCHAIGYQFAFLLFALGGSLVFLPMLWLMWRGASVRERLGKPINVSVAEEITADYHAASYDGIRGPDLRHGEKV